MWTEIQIVDEDGDEKPITRVGIRNIFLQN